MLVRMASELNSELRTSVSEQPEITEINKRGGIIQIQIPKWSVHSL